MLRTTYLQELKPLNNPDLFLSEGDEYYIITGRHSISDEYVTNDWCSKHCPNNKGVYIVGGDGINTSKAKTDKISELGIDVFFDDDPLIVKYLREALPGVVVVQIGGVKSKKTIN
jgi:hypothetical protein